VISILAPTRKRVAEFVRMVESIENTAILGNWEVLAYVDEDDSQTFSSLARRFSKSSRVFLSIGPRICMSDMWNELVPKAIGDLFMLGSDDIVFRTKAWDKIVEDAFAAVPDRLIYAHGDDLHPSRGKLFGTHGIIHRHWYDAVGYFTAKGYSADYADLWLNDVSEMLERRRFLPFVTEHLHYVFGKAQCDVVHQEKNDRRDRDNTPRKYAHEIGLREADAEKLREVIASYER